MLGDLLTNAEDSRRSATTLTMSHESATVLHGLRAPYRKERLEMKKPLIAAAFVALALPSCITTNLTAWANTRDKPLHEHIRVTA